MTRFGGSTTVGGASSSQFKYVNEPAIGEKVSQGTLDLQFFKCEIPSAHFRFKGDGYGATWTSTFPEYWTANVNGVLVFVRHILWRLYCSHPEDLIRAVFSLRWWLRSLFSAFRCYSPVQLMPPTNCSPKSPSNYQQMGQGQHSHCLLLTSLHSNPPLLSCV